MATKKTAPKSKTTERARMPMDSPQFAKLPPKAKKTVKPVK